MNSMDTLDCFKPAQLVCLDLCKMHETLLYAEVIQIVTQRHLCWARPLVMVQVGDTSIAPDNVQWTEAIATADWLDLRASADLLLPVVLFRAAYDTEVMPLIGQLHATKPPTERDRQVHQRVKAFVQQLCDAHPDAFAA
jgi:hypothetical protein